MSGWFLLLPESVVAKNTEMLWTVLGLGRKEDGKQFMKCRCSCGKEAEVSKYALANGTSKSCGHTRGDGVAKHGLSGTPEHVIWHAMRGRCGYKKGKKGHKDYQGRGITICARWLEDFTAFLADVGPRPSDEHSIDRIESDLGYWCGKRECPECGPEKRKPNCRWATRYEQARNTRANRMVTWQGRTLCLLDWGKELGIRPGLLHYRIFEGGWSVEEAMTTRPNKYTRRAKSPTTPSDPDPTTPVDSPPT